MIISFKNPVKKENEIDVNRVFDRFYSSDKARNSSSGGLGLSIVKLLTEQMGGNVEAILQEEFFVIRVKFKIDYNFIDE